MSFLHPEFLYYMLPILIILFGLLLSQAQSQEEFFSKDVMDKLRVSSNSLTLKARNALFFLVGFLMILALAQPVLHDGEIEVKSKSADILIALDISDSMLAQDVYPNRIELAKKKALRLLAKATRDRVGVIAFAKNSYLVSPLSFDTRAVSFLLSKLETSSITQKGTSFLTMLQTVASRDTNTDKKYLLILSDGGDADDFTKEIEFAKENGIIVFVLGIGTKAGAPIKQADGSFVKYDGEVIISSLNEAIGELATQTGGTYIENTTSKKDIDAMFEEIMDKSEHKELKSQVIQRYTALFYYPLVLAMLILLIALSSFGKSIQHSLPVSAFILFALMLNPSLSHAKLLDFVKLKNAKEYYNGKDYNNSAEIYEKYAKQSNNPEAYYNAANAYYKEKKYLKALTLYNQAKLQDKNQVAKKLSNMGNAFTRLGTKNTLEKAVKYYKQSLKIKEDKDTRENLEAVQKALQKEKEKDKQKKEKDKKKKKDEKEDGKERKTDEQGDNQDKADDTNNKNKNSKKDDDSKGKKSDNKEGADSKSKEKDKSSKDGNGDESDSDNESKDGSSEQQAKELKDKSKKETSMQDQSEKSKSGKSSQVMSDSEEDKWLNKLDSKQNTYLYRLNEQKIHKEDENEKPW